ncbi:MAG: N-6 DNA methylase, partial [Dermatophilaceae bacterium]
RVRDVLRHLILLSKIASAGVNGQFRTPRHIIELMVRMTAPRPSDEICDPACDTGGFLVAASEYVRETHAEALLDSAHRTHFHRSMFHGYDFDSTMLRIGSMNMLLHGVESPDIRYRDSLSEGAAGDAEEYTLIYTDFEDTVDDSATIALPGATPGTNFERFRSKAEAYLREHLENLAPRLRRNKQVTSEDLIELEQMLVAAGGEQVDIARVTEQGGGLGVFVRTLVGLDRAAVPEEVA